MGAGTELIFVEGHSNDDTYEAIERGGRRASRAALPGSAPGTGDGKGDAVRLGFARGAGDVLMILDADLTVPPEDLPRFYEALVRGRASSSTACAWSIRWKSRRCASSTCSGNKFFSVAFSWLLGQPIKDTLCGTKVLWKRDYEQHRREPRLLRRLRSVRRLRPAVRRGAS